MYQVLHDNGKILCLIGNTEMSRRAKGLLSHTHEVELVRLEDTLNNSPTWFNQRQFLLVTSDINFRLATMNALEPRHLDWFSVVGQNNILHPKIKIGHGVFIGSFNDLSAENITIGDHSQISCYCQFGENVNIGQYGHVSGYTYINNCILGTGCIVGLRSTLVNQGTVINIPEYTNFLANSMVTKPILDSGTYYGNKKIDTRDSRTHRIL